MGLYRSEDFLDKPITGIVVVPDSRSCFGALSFLFQLMQMDGTYAQVLIGELLLNGILCDLPGAVDVL